MARYLSWRNITAFEVWAGEEVMLLGTIAFAGILIEATFRLLERGTVVRWGMKVGRE